MVYKLPTAAVFDADSRITARTTNHSTAPEQILSEIMRLALLAAGGHTAILLLKRKKQLLIEAIATADSPQVTVQQAIPLSTLEAVRNHCLLLPLSLINAVVSAEKEILLSSALGSHAFADDPYIRFRQPRSILCVPLLKRSKLIGILYLENHAAQSNFNTSDVDSVKAFGKLAVDHLAAVQLC